MYFKKNLVIPSNIQIVLKIAFLPFPEIFIDETHCCKCVEDHRSAILLESFSLQFMNIFSTVKLTIVVLNRFSGQTPKYRP